MDAGDVQDIYPLAPMQQGMLFHTLYNPGSGAYVEQLSFRLEGGLDLQAFQRAWQRVVERHEALRACFAWHDLEQPLQVIQRKVRIPWSHQDWGGLEPPEQVRRFRAYLEEDRRRQFNLERAPLIRLTLIRLNDSSSYCVWTYHHLVIDGWCAATVLGEVAAVYRAERAGESVELPRSRPYRDFIAWLQRQDGSAAEVFWRRELHGASVPTRLDVRGHVPGPPPAREGDYDELNQRLEPEIVARLGAAARDHRLTLNTLVQGAWALLLNQYSDCSDVVYGVTVSGRPADLPGVESIVGCFINTLPARVRMAPGEPLVLWLRRLQEHQAAIRSYDFSSLVDIQGWSGIARGVPLFETILVFQNRLLDPIRNLDFAGLEVSDIRVWEQADYPLVLNVEPDEAGIGVRLLFDRSRFPPEAVGGMLRHFRRLLTGMPDQPEQPLAALSPLTTGERRRLLVEWNDTAAACDRDTCLHHLVEQQAGRTPEGVAVVADGREMTYRTLETRANQLAHHLLSLGVGPDVPVGVLVERSLDLPVALLATLKAGGAYLPLDVDLPSARIDQQLRAARAPVCLTQAALLDRVPTGSVAVVALDRDRPAIGRNPASPPDVTVRPDNLVSIFYTSGSTGRPKGVANTHLGWVNRMAWMQRETPLARGDVVLQKTTLTFDDSAVEFFWPLIAGGTIAVLEPGDHRDPRAIIDAAIKYRVAALHFVPSMFARVLDVITPEDRSRLENLRYVISSGEALRPELVRRFRERMAGPDSRLYNQWGATEVSIDSTRHTCCPAVGEESTTVPIGRPIDHHRVYILDRWLRPVPPGVVGELYLAGVGLARGYVHEPDRTADWFLPDPRAAGERMYRTGDRGHFLADGTICFLGRLDDQVKVRGNRVELGEVEAALATHPTVKDCGVVALPGRDGHRLIAYFVSARRPAHGGSGRPTDFPEDLRAFLGQRLPEYMVPERFIRLDFLPRTASGKLDRRSLPDPGDARPDLKQRYVVPSTPLQRTIARVWEQVLGLTRVGADDGFFDLGGHSLDATRVISRLNQEFSLDLPVRALFQSPTVTGLAERIEAARAEDHPAAGRPVPRLPRRESYGLSHAQQRFWFQYQFGPEHATGRVITAQLDGPLHREPFLEAFAGIITRHGITRTVYAERDGRPRQLVRHDLRVPCRYRDLAALDRSRQAEILAGQVARESRSPFDLQRESSFRAWLYRLRPQRHILMLNVHPIAYDGWSTEVLLDDLEILYGAAVEGREAEIPPPLQYVDFVAWQNERLKAGELDGQRDYWLEQLAGAAGPPPPASDGGPSAGGIGEMRPRLRSLGPEFAARLRDLARDNGLTLYMVLLTGLKLWLARLTGQTDVTVCTPLSGRTHPDLEGVLGLLVNPVALRTRLDGNPSGTESLRRVRETALSAYANQDYPFDLLVQDLRRRGGRNAPLYSVVLVVQNAADMERRVGDVTFSGLPTDELVTRQESLAVELGTDPTVAIDLHLEVYEIGDRLELVAKYDPRRFRPETVDRFLDQYQSVLDRLTREPAVRLSQLELPSMFRLDDLFPERGEVS